jgi:subtilase family serine protease
MEPIGSSFCSCFDSSSNAGKTLIRRIYSRCASFIALFFPTAVLIAVCATFAFGDGASSVRPDEAAAQAQAKATGMPALAGAADPSTRMTIEVVLSLRNQAELSALIPRLTDPKDAMHGKFLTPDQFSARYGPAKEDVDAVAAFLTASGLKVEEKKAAQGLVRASGTSADMERIFDVKMKRYSSPSGRIYYSANKAPVIPAAIASNVVAVLGLCNGAEIHSDAHLAAGSPGMGASDLYYSGHAGLTPADVESIYKMGNVGTTIYGGGETVAVFEEGTFLQSDIDLYFDTYISPYHFGMPIASLIPVSVDGYNTGSSPGPAQGEVTLDLDMFQALASNARVDEIFENSDQISSLTDVFQQFIDTFKSMATINTTQKLPLPNVISVSYGVSENWLTAAWNPAGPADAAAENQALAQLAAQGQTVCVSSGDAGAWTDQSQYPTEQPNTSDPASQPYVTAVGGTNLTDSSTAPYQYVSETSWYDPSDFGRGFFGTGGGGGFSQLWSIPYWQVGTFSPAVNPQASLTMRNVPDVSLYGDYDTGGYDVAIDGNWYSINGTSASSPLWAAFLTDVDAVRAGEGISPLGSANPLLYSIGEDPYFSGDFNDVADGSTNGYYAAVPGYDNSVGWGSLNGANLLNQLSLHDSYTTVTSSASPAVAGQPLTFTATVSSSDGGNPANGLVVFDGVEAGTSIGVNMTGDTAACNGSFAAPGSYTITAWYNGNSTTQISLGSFTQVVTPKNTTTVLTANPLAGTYGDPVTLKATVAAVAPGTGTPTGTVTFDTVSTNGNLIPMGASTLTNGTASYTTSKLPMGTNYLEAVYSGDSTSNGSDGTDTVQVGIYSTVLFQIPPTNVSLTTTVPGGPAPTDSWESGYDQLYALCASGGATFSYQSSAQATFNWYVEWVPSVKGEAPPLTATVTFTRYAANYTSVDGSTAPGAIGSLDLTGAASSTWGTSASVNLDIVAPSNGESASNGTQTLQDLGSWTSPAVAFQPSGSDAIAAIAVPAQALATITGTADFTSEAGGGGGSAISNIELFADYATIIY